MNSVVRTPWTAPHLRTIATVLVGLFLASTGIGCPTIYAPTLRSTEAQITGVGGGGLVLLVNVVAYNPNTFDVSIDEMTAHVELNGGSLGTTTIEQDWTMPAGQDTTIQATFTVPFTQLPGLALTALLGGQIPFRVTGEASVDNAPVTVEYTYEGYVEQSVLVGGAVNAVNAILGGKPAPK